MKLQTKLVGFRDAQGVLRAEFEDGVRVNLHAAHGRSDLFYALRPHTDEGQSLQKGPGRAYQAEAFRAFFAGIPYDTRIDRDGDLVASVQPGRRDETSN